MIVCRIQSGISVRNFFDKLFRFFFKTIFKDYPQDRSPSRCSPKVTSWLLNFFVQYNYISVKSFFTKINQIWKKANLKNRPTCIFFRKLIPFQIFRKKIRKIQYGTNQFYFSGKLRTLIVCMNECIVYACIMTYIEANACLWYIRFSSWEPSLQHSTVIRHLFTCICWHFIVT